MIKQTIILTYNTSVDVYDNFHLQLCVKGVKPSDSYFTEYTKSKEEKQNLTTGNRDQLRGSNMHEGY